MVAVTALVTPQMRSAALNFALRLLGFVSTSDCEGFTTRLLTSRTLGSWPQAQAAASGGQTHEDASLASSRFTSLSSREW